MITYVEKYIIIAIGFIITSNLVIHPMCVIEE